MFFSSEIETGLDRPAAPAQTRNNTSTAAAPA